MISNHPKKELVIDDLNKGEFLVHRSAFLDPEIMEAEREKIFSKCWLFLGHESELNEKGSFKTRKVGGRQLIFVKDSEGVLRALYNTCPHRGALVCREREGKSKVFQCFYHAWTFNNKGELIGQPGAETGAYPKDYNCDGSKNLGDVPRLENYRGFVFINFDPNAVSLEEYLAGAKEYIDLVADQSPEGMEVTGGIQEYSISANYKLLAENSYDGYHGLPTHKTYFEYLHSRDALGTGIDGRVEILGNGHAVSNGQAPWGRPIARWVPAWGEEAKKELGEIYQELANRVGEERAQRIAKTDRNMVIFPNLVINDIMAITIRTFEPVTPDYMEVRAMALAPKGESKKFRERRLNNFLEFLGPAGFATPDDVEALELVQESIKANREKEWNDISKGMKKEGDMHVTDEGQMRAYWREWHKRMV